MHPRAGDLERGKDEVAEHLLLPGDLELRKGDSRAAGRRQHHVHGQPAAALGDEVLLRGRHHVGRGAPRCVGLGPQLEATPVDAHRVAHALELGLALDGAREVELDVERHDLESLERPVVAHGHHVVEAVDADPLPAGVLRVRGDGCARMRVEPLLEQRGAVLADVARLRREDDERIAVGGDDDVRVAVDDLEAGHVRDGALEARVLAAGDDEAVELGGGHRLPDVGVAPVELCGPV